MKKLLYNLFMIAIVSMLIFTFVYALLYEAFYIVRFLRDVMIIILIVLIIFFSPKEKIIQGPPGPMGPMGLKGDSCESILIKHLDIYKRAAEQAGIVVSVGGDNSIAGWGWKSDDPTGPTDNPCPRGPMGIPHIKGLHYLSVDERRTLIDLFQKMSDLEYEHFQQQGGK